MIKKIVSRMILNYLRYFAIRQLRKNRSATIFGITGSDGKTSTMLALAHILESHGLVKYSVNANSQSGISLNILGISPVNYSAFDWIRIMVLAPIKLVTNHERFDYYVVEMGIDSPDSPGNMAYLLSIVKPHIGIVLNASLSHSAAFDHLVKDANPLRRVDKLIKVIAKEKMQLVKSLGSKGVAILNIDQKELIAERKDVQARVITFGKSDKADLKIIGVGISSKGFSATFKYQGSIYKLVLPDIYGEHYVYTFAAAVAASAAIGIPPSISLPKLSGYTSPPGRMRLFSGISGSTIFDSSYNSSPASLEGGLKLLKVIAGHRRKVCVIGDMRELGISAKNAHKDLADWLPVYCDEVLLFGDLVKEYTLPVLMSRRFKVHHFDKMSDLIKYLRSIIKQNTYVFVKGSQNKILLERAVEAILHDKKDISNLCRRGEYWDGVRAKSS